MPFLDHVKKYRQWGAPDMKVFPRLTEEANFPAFGSGGDFTRCVRLRLVSSHGWG